jgi:predicted transcriptional regulator
MKVQDLIFKILSKRQKLSARNIFEKIKTKRNITYQALHKTLKQMLKERIICKETQLKKTQNYNYKQI